MGPSKRRPNGQALPEENMIVSAPIIPFVNPAASAPRNLLEVKNLTHIYGNGVRALTDVSLGIARGLYGLLGPNGAGKSTLMRTIATLQKPTSGEVIFDGIDALADPMRLRATLGYLPQDFGVYPRVSAESLLDHLAVLKGIGPTKARREEV